jgi:hypothetical protein
LFDQKVYKYFDEQKEWYWGRVDGFDHKNKYFLIAYNDGDGEDMTLKEVLEWKKCADEVCGNI